MVLQNSSRSENKWINYSNVDYPVLGSFDNADVQILDIVEDMSKIFGWEIMPVQLNSILKLVHLH